MNDLNKFLKYCQVTTNEPPVQLIARQLVELFEKIEQEELRKESIKTQP